LSLVSNINHEESDTKGAVFKIPVSRSRSSASYYNSLNQDDDSNSNGEGTEDEAEAIPEDFIIISWIFE
jgi:hypothetical protein